MYREFYLICAMLTDIFPELNRKVVEKFAMMEWQFGINSYIAVKKHLARQKNRRYVGCNTVLATLDMMSFGLTPGDFVRSNIFPIFVGCIKLENRLY